MTLSTRIIELGFKWLLYHANLLYQTKFLDLQALLKACPISFLTLAAG